MLKVKQQIIESINEALKNGTHLIDGDWGTFWNFCQNKWESKDNRSCALGTCLIKYQPEVDFSQEKTIAQLLEVSETYIDGFIHGFDSQYAIDWNPDFDIGYKDGQCVRQMFLKYINTWNTIERLNNDETVCADHE